MLEAKIEVIVCDYARERGLLVYKFTSPNRAAVPDRLMILPSGHTFFVEFKRTGQKPTPAQVREHVRLRQQNATVFVIDCVDEGKAMVDKLCAGLGV